MTRIEKKGKEYILWVQRETMWVPILISKDKQQIDYMKRLYEESIIKKDLFYDSFVNRSSCF